MQEYSGRKVLVTGADGFIGSHLTERLAAEGAEVTALACYSSFDSHGWLDDLPYATRMRLDLRRGDVRDAKFIHSLVRGQEIVFHLAALIAIPYSYVAPQSYVDTNVLGTLNVLEAAREHRVTRVVHTSTSEVYGTALTVPIHEDHPLQGQSPYSASKIGADMMAEAFARSFGLPVAVLRPFNTFGPRQSERAIISSVIRQALDPACDVIEIGDISTVRDFNYVRDTADAFVKLGMAPEIEYGRPYNAGSGTAVTIAEVIEHIADLTRCNKPVRQTPERMRPENSEVRALLADSARLFEATGWRAQVTLEDGLATTIRWWQNRLDHHLVRSATTFVT
ncbi:MAG: SDR family NAD(P)-dependent oxidoreductase [Acetobacteraceae bacterium]|nr:SDR family NAD(P)-dependent oxidoreductase [Acetobacteraceae bacterium]